MSALRPVLSRTGASLVLAAVLFAFVIAGATAARSIAHPRYGGTLVVGLSRGDPNSLDPTYGNTPSTLEINLALCQRLYDRDALLRLVPVLAAGAPVASRDGLTYRIRLREGVLFNDGTPLDAGAVVASVRRYMATPASPRAADFASIDSVRASGPSTVVFHLKRPDSGFVGGNPYVLSPTRLAKLGDDFASDPVCVGPFMFGDRVVGDHVTLVRSPYYYDRQHVYLDRIVYRAMPDGPAAAAALEAGDVQALDQVATPVLKEIQQREGVRVIRGYQLGWKGLTVNIGNRSGVDRLPYANVGSALASSAKLRQAFEEAIDRTALDRVAFGGLMQVTCTPIAPANTMWYEGSALPCTPYDPEHARKLVAASGIPHPTVHVLATNIDEDRLVSQFVQVQEKAVGIDVVIDTTDAPTSISRAASGDFDVRIGGAAGNADPDWVISPFLRTGASRNYSGYTNPKLDQVLTDALRAPSVGARAALYRTAQRIIHDDRPVIPLYNPVTFAAFRTDITGVELTYLGVMAVAHAQYR